MAEETKLYQAIAGLHQTDIKLWNKITTVSGELEATSGFLSGAIGTLPDGVTSVVAEDKKISDELLPGVTFNNKGTDSNFVMGSNIKFIGNCNVTQDPATGQLIIRIGDNLNSSTFNMKDGITDGTVKLTKSTTPSTKVTKIAGSKEVWKLDGTDEATVTTSGKIHFDDATNTKFTVKVTANGAEAVAYDCGPVTGNGTFGTSPVTLTVSNWAAESKTAEGATGYEANVTFAIDLDQLVTVEGPVSFEITMTGTNGGKTYSSGSIGYFIIDTTTAPSVSAFTAKLTTSATQTYGGITTLKSGTVTYAATVANLNNPATDASTGASLQITNDGFAAGVTKAAQTVYGGQISRTGNFTTTTKRYASADLDASITVWNINSSATLSAKLADASGVEITAIDFYSGTPNASILGTGNRKTLDSTDATKTAYVDADAPGANDLMVYHGELQYPAAFITNSYFANGSYVAPSTTGDKSALFWFSASGTEKGGTLVINGSGLTTGVKAVVLGNSVNNLLDITSTAGIGTAPSKTATKLTFPYTFKTEGDYITSSSGCWVKITLSGAGAKITSITRG